MSFSTFSGPVRSGTVRYGSGENTGLVVLSQSATIAFGTTTKTLAVLPAGSQILNVIVDTTTQFDGAGATLALGDGTTADKYMGAATVTGGASGSRILQSVIDAALKPGNITNIGTSDVTVVGTVTTASSAGAATVTILYVQKASDGSEVPATP